MRRQLFIMGLALISFMTAAISAKNSNNPASVLSENGRHALNLQTETAYAIINKGTRIMSCLPSSTPSTIGPDILNPQHWWKITPSRYFNAKKPTYELVNYKNSTPCAMGKKLIFYPSSKHVDEDGRDTFLLSTDQCRRVKTCSDGNIYNGVVLLNPENQTAHFCGNLDFSCISPQQSKDLTRLNQTLQSRQRSSNSYQFHFLPYTPLLKEKYDILGRVQDFKIANITEEFKKRFTKKQEIGEGWRIGFADEISNCASFQQEKEVRVNFTNVESSRMTFSEETFSLTKKLSKFSIVTGSSISIPLFRLFSPLFALSSRAEWGSERMEWTKHSSKESKEMRKKVVYQYTSRVTIQPWRVAKVHTFLSVVKDLPISWEADSMITVGRAGDSDGRMGCLGEENIRNILNLEGHDLDRALWNETLQGFRFPASGEIIVSYGMESYVQVTDKECPPEKQVHRSEF